MVLPLFVDETAAVAIAFRLMGRPTPHPLAHDLLDRIVPSLGGRLTEVRIDGLKDHVYQSHVVIQQANRQLVIEARPSDAVSMALAAKVPVYTTRQVMAEGGISRAEIDSFGKEPADLGPGVGGSGNAGTAPAPALPPLRRRRRAHLSRGSRSSSRPRDWKARPPLPREAGLSRGELQWGIATPYGLPGDESGRAAAALLQRGSLFVFCSMTKCQGAVCATGSRAVTQSLEDRLHARPGHGRPGRARGDGRRRDGRRPPQLLARERRRAPGRAEAVRREARRAGRTVAILQDLQGPKIRLGKFAQGRVEVEPGETVLLSTRPRCGGEPTGHPDASSVARRATVAWETWCCWTTGGSACGCGGAGVGTSRRRWRWAGRSTTTRG